MTDTCVYIVIIFVCQIKYKIHNNLKATEREEIWDIRHSLEFYLAYLFLIFLVFLTFFNFFLNILVLFYNAPSGKIPTGANDVDVDQKSRTSSHIMLKINKYSCYSTNAINSRMYTTLNRIRNANFYLRIAVATFLTSKN